MTFDWPHPIEGVFFDMDGTLLDSEPLTEAAVSAFLTNYGIDTKVDATQFHGVTWFSIASTLVSLFPTLEGVEVADELSMAFQHALRTQTPPPIPGAYKAVSSSAGLYKTAVVSSSRRQSIRFVVGKMGLSDIVHHIVGAEDVQYSKPHPQCFQMAADHFGIPYERCLVFEDSIAGLQAAHNGGMATVAIGSSAEKEPFSTMMVEDYNQLEQTFFKQLGSVEIRMR